MSASNVHHRDDGQIEIERDGKRIAYRDANGEIGVSGSDAARMALAEDVFLPMDNYHRVLRELRAWEAQLEAENKRLRRGCEVVNAVCLDGVVAWSLVSKGTLDAMVSISTAALAGDDELMAAGEQQLRAALEELKAEALGEED